jgi:flagellar export protein FliJ
MPSFRFHLQPLLDERLRVEEAAQSVLGSLARAHASARAELSATDAAISACTASLAAESGHSVHAALAHAGLLQRRRTRVTYSLERAETAQQAAQTSLERARLARELLETMRRNAQEAFTREEAFVDEREFDEINHAGVLALK